MLYQQLRKKNRGQSCSTKCQLIDDAIQTSVEMELLDKENLLIENSRSCETEIAVPLVRSMSTETNAIDRAMTEENEDHLATISRCSQTETVQIMIFLFAQKKKFLQKKRKKLKVKMNALKDAHS